MESDGLLTSRRGEIKVGERERIPPKYYSINEKYRKEEETKREFMEIPSDRSELHDFLLSEIRNYRSAVFNVVRLVNYLSSSLNYLDYNLEDSEKAKQIYKEFLSGINEPEFNFVFLDVVMPGIASIDVLKEIKKISPETKVVMITDTLMDKALLDELIQKGALGYLQKPFKIEDIKEIIS